MNYPTVKVNGISVRVDEEGRYNLNDLHAAAVANGEATESQRPSNFAKAAKIKSFAHELTAATNVAALKIINGGHNHGVWGLELIAIRYAAWLSAKFEIKVYQTFQAVIRNGLDALNRLNRIDAVINRETREVSQCASKMARWGIGGRKQLLHTARERVIQEVQLYLPGMAH
ncbi:KilA family DNA-binding protein [Tatumella ptyseos ATCC 33301]|uniref:KilA family DNA-binding protein n=2 Tax=Tatumella ptyseos TaxID=82987 RepID=A0A085JGU2_9GAMM|nr:KilA-N domain-containing protein [Tatumella ptyseos]KFD19688.1 KilA family DNA-binding protein [Tatumella ptyseos ATCC 33301]SQK75749.1 KilA-N domain [Tatumella ptyseos]